MTGRKSRQLIDRDIHDGKLPQGYGFCRKCQTIKTEVMFSKATESTLDSNGLLSVCKSCVDNIYLNVLESENGNITKTILTLCRMLNVRFEQSAIDSALKHIETKQSDSNKVFGLYRAKLLVLFRTSMGDTNIDLTYKDNPIINLSVSTPMPIEVERDVVDYWGKGYETDDYNWLEKNLGDWKKTHKCDTKAEETLLKEIVFKQFEIEKARQEQKSTANLVKELQDLMKTASVDPAKANKAGEGKSQETFSAFIKMIEEDEPAEVFGDEREAFKDFQNIEKYFEKYVTRPLSNFVKMSRDFNVEDNGDNDEDISDFELSEIFLPEEENVEEEKQKNPEE